MFEKPASDSPMPSQQGVEGKIVPVRTVGGEPVEFIFQGQHLRVHAILSRWKASGGWWNRIGDGDSHQNEKFVFDDKPRIIWEVEAAPLGTLSTYRIEFDENTKDWLLRSTSRPA